MTPNAPTHGFTLLEILLSLLLCTLLTLSLAAAIATAARANELATRQAEAIPLLETLYTALRLSPSAPPPPLPPPWRCHTLPSTLPAPQGHPIWHATTLLLHPTNRALAPIPLRLYHFEEPSPTPPPPQK